MADLEKSAASYSMEEFADDVEADQVSEVASEQIDEDISEVASEEYSEDFDKQKSPVSDSHEDYSESFADGTPNATEKGRGSEEHEEVVSGGLSASEDVGASSASASGHVGITAARGSTDKVGASPVPAAPVGIAAASVHVGDAGPPAAEEYSQQSYEEDFAEGTVDTAGFDQSRSESLRTESQEVSQSVSARTQERRRVAEEEEKARKSEEQSARERIEQRRRQIAEQQQQQVQQEIRMPSVKEEFPSPLAKAADEDAYGQSLSLLSKADGPDAKSAESEVSELDEDVDEMIEESDEEEMQSKHSSENEAEQSSWEQAKRKADAEMKRQGEAEEARRQEEVAELANREAKEKAEEEARRKAEEEARSRAEAEAKREAEEEVKQKAEEARRKAEEDAKRMAEEEAQNKAQEEERRKAEEEERRKAEEEEERRKAEEEEKRKSEEEERWKAEQEERRKSEEEERRKSEEKEKQKADEDAKRKADEEASRRAEEKIKLEAEERGRREEELRRQVQEEARRADEQAAQDARERAEQAAREQAAREAEEKAIQKEAHHGGDERGTKSRTSTADDVLGSARKSPLGTKSRTTTADDVMGSARKSPLDTKSRTTTADDVMGSARKSPLPQQSTDDPPLLASEQATFRADDKDEQAEMPSSAAPLDVELSIKPKRRLGKAKAALGPAGLDAPQAETLDALNPLELDPLATSAIKSQPLTAADALFLSMEARHSSESAAQDGKEKEEESRIQTQAGKSFSRDDKENWHESTSGTAMYGQTQEILRNGTSGIAPVVAMKSDMVAVHEAETKVASHDEIMHQSNLGQPAAQRSTWDSGWAPRSSGDHYVSDQQWARADFSLHEHNKQGAHSSWWTSQNSWWNRSAEGWNWGHSSWQPSGGMQWGSSDNTDVYSWSSQQRGRSEERQDLMQFRNKQNLWPEKASWALPKQPEAVAPRIAWDAKTAGFDGSSGDAFIGAESAKHLMRSLGREAFFASGWDPDALYRRSDAQGAWLQDTQARGGKGESSALKPNTFSVSSDRWAQSQPVLQSGTVSNFGGQDQDRLGIDSASAGLALSSLEQSQDVQLRELRQAKELRELREAKEVAERASAEAQKVAEVQKAASAKAQKKAEEMTERALAEARKSAEDAQAARTLAEAAASAPEIRVDVKGASTDAEAGFGQWQRQSLQARESSLLQADLLNLSDLSPQEFGKFAMQAIGEVCHDLLELKYNSGLDIDEFVERGARACGEYALLSVQRLLQKLNSETQLRFLDRRREQLLQLRLEWRVLNDFDSLRRTVRLIPGTASAVAIITAGGGHALDVAAVFRVAYSDSGMVVGRSGRGGRQPLRHFGDADLCGAVAIDPIIVSMCPVNAPLSGITPAPAPEYVSLEALLQDGFKTSATAPNSSTSRVPQSLLAVMHALAPTVDVFKKVAEVLERPDVEPESVLEVMGKLVEWLKHEPQATLARRGLAASKGHVGIVAALRRHRSQCAFAASACRVIGWASRHHVENAVMFVECSAATDICGVLEMHRADKDLHRHGLYAIGCLAHYGGGAAQAISAGALGIVHRSLGLHRDSPSVQINGCEVLRCLAESGDAPMEDLGRLALDAKRAFPRDQTVHRAADALLALVVPRTVCSITMLMDTQLADAEVQNSGSRTLGQLAAYGGVAWRGAAAGAVSRISRAMSLHRDNVALQAVGLWALGRLAERVEAPSAGMYDAAARAKATHSESALVQRHAGQLLAYLSSRPS